MATVNFTEMKSTVIEHGFKEIEDGATVPQIDSIVETMRDIEIDRSSFVPSATVNVEYMSGNTTIARARVGREQIEDLIGLPQGYVADLSRGTILDGTALIPVTFEPPVKLVSELKENIISELHNLRVPNGLSEDKVVEIGISTIMSAIQEWHERNFSWNRSLAHVTVNDTRNGGEWIIATFGFVGGKPSADYTIKQALIRMVERNFYIIQEMAQPHVSQILISQVVSKDEKREHPLFRNVYARGFCFEMKMI